VKSHFHAEGYTLTAATATRVSDPAARAVNDKIPFDTDRNRSVEGGTAMKPHVHRLCILLLALGSLSLVHSSYALAEEADTHEGLVVSAGAGKLSMTGVDGKDHSYEIGDMVKITVNGHMGKLDDLKTGARIRVTTDKTGHALNVATVDATKRPMDSL
jgi:hypothetical protein